MADQVQSVLIEDSRISDITDKEIFGVHSSASQSTYQQYAANTQSNSSITFNCQIPSENIVIDREVRIQSTVTFTLTFANVPPGDSAFVWGEELSFQAFPLNSLFTTTQVTINNVSTSTNLKDIKDVLLRMIDKRKLNRLNSMTPSYPDSTYGMYADASQTNSNPMASYNNIGYDESFIPRGSFPLSIYNVVHHNSLTGTTDTLLSSAGLGDTWTVTIQAQFTEPFLALSPFINTDSNNKAGLLGVNTMAFNLLIDSQCSRVLSISSSLLADFSGLTSYLTNVTLGGTLNGQQWNGFTDTKLLFNFLSLQPDQYSKLSTKNIVPYSDFPRFLTTFNQNTTIQPFQTTRITTQSVQLSQIPDKIFVVCRVPMSQQNWNHTASFLTIKSISVNFNNASGLLASCLPQDLFSISVRNGSTQTFYEFGGVAYDSDAVYYNPTNNQLATIGSILVLDPVYDFSLPSYLAGGSLGQFQLQMNIQVYNQFPFAITPEVCIITMNSGFFCTQTGTSSIFTGVLTKDVVLDSKEQNPIPHFDSDSFDRMVGGSIFDRGASSVGKLVHHFKKHILPNIPKAVELAKDMSGSGGSGAGFSAGKRIAKYVK